MKSMNPLIKPGRMIGAAILTTLLLCTVVSMAGTRRAAAQPSAAANTSKSAAPPVAAAANDEPIQGLKLDLAQMQALVQQMEVNLAHVDSGQTFLKHQFQLEIDAWKVMIGSMQRRISAMEKK
ncbi:MAG TPA: hypothetical protein VNW97_19650 [Candidatus Saccharimonadales bacterium]|nr:hypothetical protein [Candidatus Saccharimonadales bacterium]